MQLDPRMPKQERLRQLEKVAWKIEYDQRATAKAVRSHTKTRYRKLRAMGIYVSRIRKCYHVF